jgi:hypothetical protein
VRPVKEPKISENVESAESASKALRISTESFSQGEGRIQNPPRTGFLERRLVAFLYVDSNQPVIIVLPERPRAALLKGGNDHGKAD